MKIAVHAFNGITLFHMATPMLVFGEVGRQGLAADWVPTLWTSDGAPIRTAEGVVVDIAGPAVVEDADIVVFPSWPDSLPAPSAETLALIRRRHAAGAMITGLCLGAFPVAASGILDGRSAVTHWEGASSLAQLHAGVDVQASALYIDHGDVLTSAGTASALDACLHIVRTRLGSEAAAAVARRLVIAPHREGGQAQYIERPVAPTGGDDAISRSMAWALANLSEDLSVTALAEHAAMSKRNFARLFRAATGTTPAKWVMARRLDESRRLLETSDEPITGIARLCGFASPVTFRQNFVEAYATSPTSYRRHFGEEK